MGRRLAWFLVVLAILAGMGACHAYTRTLAPGVPNYCHALSSYKWPECNR